MKKLLFILLLTRYLDGSCQDITSRFVEIPDYVEFKGAIDSKYNITMLLYTNYKFAFGKYYYDKIKEEIPLNGNIIRAFGYVNDVYFEKENVELIEYDNSNNKRAQFKGEIINNSIFRGNWLDYSKNKTLPFELKVSNFKPLTKFDRYSLELKIDSSIYCFNISKNFVYRPKVDTLIHTHRGNKYYCLLFVSYPSSGGCYGRGNCGCGLEQYLIYLSINKDIDSQNEQVLYYESCLGSITSDHRIFTDKENWFNVISKFDLNNFERYVLKISDIQNKQEKVYELKSDCLECGFQIISDKRVEY